MATRKFLSRTLAQSVLVIAAFLLLGLAYTPRPATTPPSTVAGSDLDLFDAIVDRMVDGRESYYDAYGTELRARGYPAASVFNWRPPLLYWTLAWIGRDAGRFALSVLVILLLLSALLALRSSPLAVRIATIAALAAALAPAVGARAVLVADVWAGVFLGFSACAYLAGWRPAGAALALAAAALRELAAPYVLVTFCLALRDRPRTELRVWVIGGALLAAYTARHLVGVVQHRHADDLAHTVSWLYFGGLHFLLSTIRVNPLFDHAFAGAALGAIVAAVLGRLTIAHLRWTAASYVIAFLIVGQPVNDYWGYVTAPLWALAIGQAFDFRRESSGPVPSATGVPPRPISLPAP